MTEHIKKILRFKGDRTIWVILGILLAISLLIVYSATGTMAYLHKDGNTAFFVFKRLKLIVPCIFIILIVSSIHYKYFSLFAGLVWFTGLTLVVVMQFAGVEVNGSTRWLHLPIIGMNFQPAEVAKLGIIMYASRLLSLNQLEKNCKDAAFWHVCITSGFVLLFIFLGDFSTSAIIGLVVFALCLIGRVRLKLLGIVFVCLFSMFSLLVVAGGYFPNIAKLGTINKRVMSYFGKNDNDKSDDVYIYQIEQSKIAVATGGMLGKGPGNSVQRNFLPLPYSDFVYAVLIEEGGWFLGLFVLFLYFIFLFRVGMIVYKSRRVFPALLILGLGLSIIFQALVNMGVTLGVFPITGQPLPLISMGGSSLIFTSIALGMILSVSYYVKKEEEEELSVKSDEDE